MDSQANQIEQKEYSLKSLADQYFNYGSPKTATDLKKAIGSASDKEKRAFQDLLNKKPEEPNDLDAGKSDLMKTEPVLGSEMEGDSVLEKSATTETKGDLEQEIPVVFEKSEDLEGAEGHHRILNEVVRFTFFGNQIKRLERDLEGVQSQLYEYSNHPIRAVGNHTRSDQRMMQMLRTVETIKLDLDGKRKQRLELKDRIIDDFKNTSDIKTRQKVYEFFSVKIHQDELGLSEAILLERTKEIIAKNQNRKKEEIELSKMEVPKVVVPADEPIDIEPSAKIKEIEVPKRIQELGYSSEEDELPRTQADIESAQAEAKDAPEVAEGMLGEGGDVEEVKAESPNAPVVDAYGVPAEGGQIKQPEPAENKPSDIQEDENFKVTGVKPATEEGEQAEIDTESGVMAGDRQPFDLPEAKVEPVLKPPVVKVEEAEPDLAVDNPEADEELIKESNEATGGLGRIEKIKANIEDVPKDTKAEGVNLTELKPVQADTETLTIDSKPSKSILSRFFRLKDPRSDAASGLADEQIAEQEKTYAQ